MHSGISLLLKLTLIAAFCPAPVHSQQPAPAPVIKLGAPSRVLIRIGKPFRQERHDIILETNAAVESVRQAHEGGMTDRPRPEWVRGICPQCGEELVSNCYYVGGRGYLVVWECWASLGENPSCVYRKVL